MQFRTFWHNYKFGQLSSLQFMVQSLCMNSTHQIFRYLLGGIFKYRFDFIHLFFSKVNYSEVNSPILLNAHFPRE